MMAKWPVCGMCLWLTACGTNLEDIGRAPDMTPIGDGMTASVSQIVAPAKPRPEPARYSLWPSGKESMFHDHRARTEGDVITVLIQINDWASLDNSTKRSPTTCEISTM